MPDQVGHPRPLRPQPRPGGALLLGAAETVIGLTDRLVPDTKNRGLYGHAEVARPTALRAAVG